MLNHVVSIASEIENAIKVFKVDLIFSIIINFILIAILFRITDICINKIKSHITNAENPVLSGHFIPVLEKFTKFLILFIIVAAFLQSNGYSITSLIAAFGVTGLAIGFAAQQTVADFFGTVTIIADKMYKMGDYIKIGNYEGYVTDVNLLSTKIRTLDDFLVIIPNNNVSTDVIVNLSRAKKRRINEVFSLTYDTTDEKLKEAMNIINVVCANNNKLYQEPLIVIDSLAASSIDIRLCVSAKTGDYTEFSKIKSDLILEIVEKFRKNGIDFAFPSQSVYIEKQ